MPEVHHHERPITAVGHLSVHIEGDHPEDTPFMFEQVWTRLFGALGVTFVAETGIVVVLVLLAFYYSGTAKPADTVVQTVIPPGIIWIPKEGPGGGGGGGGNQMKEPPKKIELPGKDTLSVPAEKPKPLQVPKEIKPNDTPLPQIAQLDAKSMQLGAVVSPGTFDGVPNGISQGSGSGGGAGTGTGTGIGPGNGPGVGPGWGGGTGGGAYRPGNGISLPKPVREVKPSYTAEAMRAKIQGTVIVECVVLPDGTVGDVQVVKPLDSAFGLDQEAIKAAKQWRFIPGTRNGQPVPVLISIELTFHLV